MTEEEAGTRGIKIALAGYSALVTLQVATYFMTGILVLYAQAFEMLSDVLISTFLLLSVYWSRKPADEFHMFGHGSCDIVPPSNSGYGVGILEDCPAMGMLALP